MLKESMVYPYRCTMLHLCHPAIFVWPALPILPAAYAANCCHLRFGPPAPGLGKMTWRELGNHLTFAPPDFPRKSRDKDQGDSAWEKAMRRLKDHSTSSETWVSEMGLVVDQTWGRCNHEENGSPSHWAIGFWESAICGHTVPFFRLPSKPGYWSFPVDEHN